MAFNIHAWSRVSSSANTPAKLDQDGVYVGAPAKFSYISAQDTAATISAADYFNTVAAELGVDDTIRAVGSDSTIELTVTAVSFNPTSVTTSTAGGAGDVDGPATSTDNAAVRFDGATGKIIQDSSVIISDADAVSGVTQLDVDNLRLNTNTISSTDTNGDVNLSPNGSGTVVIDTDLDVDNLNLNGNTISSTDTNGNISIIPDGTGEVLINADPVVALGAATKQYVDASNANQTWKDSVVASSNSELTATYDNGTAGVGATLTNSGAQAAFSLDGVSPNQGDRVLIKDQSSGGSAFENGIYTVTTVGTGASNWVLTRATDFDESAEMTAGSVVPVIGGTINANTGWMLDTDISTVGTDTVDFTIYIEGTGLWLDQTTTPVTLVPQISYVANTAGLLTFNMPSSAAFGDIFEVAGTGAGGWLIQFTTGQTGNLAGSATTTGTGSFASSSQFDTIEFICTVANTTFVAIKAVGNITVA